MNTKIKAYGIAIYKYEKDILKILLCKSVSSKERWGFLKGVQEKDETKAETAIRELYEESSISVKYEHLEKYFEQENEDKDIGIYLVNYDNITKYNHYFEDNKLLNHHLSWENSDVEFFTLDDIPKIKKKQKSIMKKIIEHFKKI
ncbi:MAG: NUDIX domain-containing protein [Campylobacterota bacterium]|nr:NUDIX domain-containing protein [Campylobacterota bacterium]